VAATATARKYIDNAPTPTLTGAINGTATVVTLSTLVGLPTSYPYFGTLDLGTATAEVVKVTGTPGTNQLTITRNANGLGVYSHSSSGTFDHTLVAADLQDANDHSVATGGVHGVSGNVVGTTDVQTLTNKTLTSPTVNSPTFNAGGLVPVGCVLPYAGSNAPSGYVLADGTNQSRTGLSALKSALCPQVTGSITSGSATVTGVSAADIATLQVTGPGIAVEGVGIPAGTTIVSFTTTTFLMSANATATTAGLTITGFPFGNGNGSTTFGIPDLRTNFPRGVGPFIGLASVGGAVQHTHTLGAGYAQVALATNNLGFKSSTASVASWTGDFSYAATRAADGTTRTTGVNLGGATDNGSNVPPYTALNYIIKT
jgi:microcystin-dependent protein